MPTSSSRWRLPGDSRAGMMGGSRPSPKETSMPAWIRNLAAAVSGRVPTVLTLALLAGLGVWGARNEWKLPSLARLWGRDAARDKEAATVKVLADPANP